MLEGKWCWKWKRYPWLETYQRKEKEKKYVWLYIEYWMTTKPNFSNRYWINFPLLVCISYRFSTVLLQYRHFSLWTSIFPSWTTTMLNKLNDGENALLFSLYCPGYGLSFLHSLSLCFSITLSLTFVLSFPLFVLQHS